VSGSSGTYTLSGTGNTSTIGVASATITPNSKVEGKNISLTIDAGLGVDLVYTGQKQ
jgi:hypothetical protein